MVRRGVSLLEFTAFGVSAPEVAPSDLTKLLTDAWRLYREFSHMAYRLEHPVRTAARATNGNNHRKFLGRMGSSGVTFGSAACSCPGIAGSGMVLAQLWTAVARPL